MSQSADFSLGAEVHIESPQHTSLREVLATSSGGGGGSLSTSKPPSLYREKRCTDLTAHERVTDHNSVWGPTSYCLSHLSLGSTGCCLRAHPPRGSCFCPYGACPLLAGWGLGGGLPVTVHTVLGFPVYLWRAPILQVLELGNTTTPTSFPALKGKIFTVLPLAPRCQRDKRHRLSVGLELAQTWSLGTVSQPEKHLPLPSEPVSLSDQGLCLSPSLFFI